MRPHIPVPVATRSQPPPIDSAVRLAAWSGVKMKDAVAGYLPVAAVEAHCAALAESLERLHEEVRDQAEADRRRAAERCRASRPVAPDSVPPPVWGYGLWRQTRAPNEIRTSLYLSHTFFFQGLFGQPLNGPQSPTRSPVLDQGESNPPSASLLLPTP